MSPLFLTLVLLAGPAKAPATPRGPADAEFAFFVPDFSVAADLVPFLDAAGDHSALLRREGWRNDVHPLLRVDVSRKDSLVEAGIDPAGSGTLSFRGDYTFSCVTLADPKKYETACADRLKGYGVPFRKELDGATIVGAKDSLDRVIAGYAIRGRESCALSGQGTSVEKPLLELGKLLGKPPTTAQWKAIAGLPGQAMLIAPRVAVGLKGSGLTLTSEFKSARAPVARLAGAGPTPYGGATWDGMFWLRMRVDPTQLAPELAQLAAMLQRLCPACDPAALTDTATALAPTLTGNAVVYVQQVKVQGSLRTLGPRFFAHKGAFLAEASDPKAARAALENLSRIKGAKASDDGYTLQLRDGTLQLGVRDNHVYLADDAAALAALFKGLPAAESKQAHGAEYSIDPERVAKALAQVPVVDVLAVPELAALLAISAEAGPLLLASEKMTGYADTDASGTVRGQHLWTLKKKQP